MLSKIKKALSVAKILKYAALVPLFLKIGAAVDSALHGQDFKVAGDYSVDGKIVDVEIKGKVRA